MSNANPIEDFRSNGASAADLKRTRRQRQPSVQEQIDRLPPNDTESEQAALGAILTSPETITECIEQLRAGEGKEFYDLRHATIYKTMVELFEDDVPIDVVNLQQRLKVWNLLEQVGGIAYISTLPDKCPSSENLSSYLETITQKFLLRQMIQTCTNAVARVYDSEGDTDALLDEVERDVLRVAESRTYTGTPPIGTLVRESIQEIEDTYNRKGELSGLATGFIDLDRMTNGLQQSEVIVIAARPSMGKTSLAMNIVENVSVNNKVPVGVFSLEMSGRALVKRMLCSRARVNLRNVQDGFLADRDFPRLTSAAGAINVSPIYIDDAAGLSILQLRAKARRMWQQYDIKLFVIDYLQLLNAAGNRRKSDSRQQEISDISCGIKALAKELSVPIVVLSQLNRDVERDKSRKPRMSDLRESGSIEQDADVVGMLYKPTRDEEGSEQNEQEQDAIPVNLLIAKQRNGPTGDVNLTFLKSYTRFENASRVSDDDVPSEAERELQGRLMDVD